MRTVTRDLYTYDELSADSKETAVKAVREKLDGPWWDSSDTEDVSNTITYEFATQLGSPRVEDFGVADFTGIDSVSLEGWSLDGGRYVLFHGTLDRSNAPKLPWVDGLDAVYLRSRRSYTEVSSEGYSGFEATPFAHERMTQAVKDAIDLAGMAGEAEAEYKTSEATAREWCENNEVQEYLADGQLAD